MTAPNWVTEFRSGYTTEQLADAERRHADPTSTVTLCCKDGVCVASPDGLCPASTELVECDHGQSNADGSATCFDDDDEPDGGSTGG